jgi:hypothetical protein
MFYLSCLIYFAAVQQYLSQGIIADLPVLPKAIWTVAVYMNGDVNWSHQL